MGLLCPAQFPRITLFQWLQSKGLVTAQATTSAWIESTIPVFTALLGWLGLKERIGWIRIGGILLAALDMLLVISRGNFASLWVSGFGTPGDYLILASALNWAVFSVLSRRGLKTHPATLMMFYVMLLGWLISSIVFFSGSDWMQIPHLTRAGWTGIAFLGIICSGLAYIAWYDALQALPAAQVGAFLYIEPIVTMFVAAMILNEKITLASLQGGGIILLGVSIVNRPKMTRDNA